jgi:hypothetical protein
MRKIIIYLSILFIVFLGVFLLFGYPLLINKDQEEVFNLNTKAKDQDRINPIEDIDLSTGENLVYLCISDEDIEGLPSEMGKCKLFECRDNSVLSELQNNFWFLKSSGDMATCRSKIFVYKNNKLVLSTSFVLSNDIVGIQNRIVGWADAIEKEELKHLFVKFKPTYWPIVKF